MYKTRTEPLAGGFVWLIEANEELVVAVSTKETAEAILEILNDEESALTTQE